MAYEHGTAANSIDLWDKFVSFITTNADLVAADEAWSIVWEAPTGQKNGIVLKGPGASTLDTILVGMERIDSTAQDENLIWLRGMTGYLDGATNIADHINVSPRVGAYFDANPMEYWFVASGRRFVVVVKMSTVYSAFYGGFYLPYASPLTYPYPLFVGGSLPDIADVVTSWRSQSIYHQHFMSSGFYTASSAPPSKRSSSYVMDPTGNWLNTGKDVDANINFGPQYFNITGSDGLDHWPIYREIASGQQNYGYFSIFSRLEENIGGGYSLTPFSLIQSLPTPQTFGVLDGCYSVPGYGNAVENIVQIDGVDHLVVQNVYSTSVGYYWALKLE